MYLLSALHGQGDVGAGCPRAARPPSAALHELAVRAEHVEHLRADARHDVHVGDDVRRVGELDADLGDRRADRAHAVGDHVERAALHRAGEEAGQRAPSSRPGRPSCWSDRRRPCAREQMKVRSSTRATSAGSERTKMLFGRTGSSGIAVPACTIRRSIRWYSSGEPSHQWTWSGWQRAATWFTQSARCVVPGHRHSLGWGASPTGQKALQAEPQKLSYQGSGLWAPGFRKSCRVDPRA